MRVIAGTARSLKLKTVKGMDTRPTGDKIKETLFNIINFDLPGSTFLDLYAGSGAIGIEALSRGAKKAVFVENNKEAVKCITDNLKFTHLYDRADVLCDRSESVIEKTDMGEFNFIFMDPPYNMDYEKKILKKLSNIKLNPDVIVIVEASLRTDFSYISKLGFTLDKEKLYKNSKHVFFSLGGK